MVYSMTGFGKAVIEKDGQIVTTEITTVNHRFLDIKLHSSHVLGKVEEDIKRILRKYFERGRVHVTIHMQDGETSPYNVTVDWNLLDQYMKRLDEVKERYSIESNISLETITEIPDLFIVEQNEDILLQIKELMMASVEEAAKQTKESRLQEGLFLKKDLLKRTKNIEQSVLLLEKQQPDVLRNYYERIQTRVKDYLKDIPKSDNNRIYQEIALLIEKGDITEEITRLKSHLKQMLSLLLAEREREAVGKKLDFIVQEVHRELNTLGAKAIDAKMTEIVVDCKSELEKLREQIQNIE